MAIGWSTPLAGWYKLNMNGSSLGNLGPAGTGGLIRDPSENWVKGYARNLGIASNILAEL